MINFYLFYGVLFIFHIFFIFWFTATTKVPIVQRTVYPLVLALIPIISSHNIHCRIVKVITTMAVVVAIIYRHLIPLVVHVVHPGRGHSNVHCLAINRPVHDRYVLLAQQVVVVLMAEAAAAIIIITIIIRIHVLHSVITYQHRMAPRTINSNNNNVIDLVR